MIVQLLWPRGVDQGLRRRLRGVRARLTSATRATAAAAAMLAALSGGWIVYNTAILNRYATQASVTQYLADYEKRYLRYAALPQPVVGHVEVAVALYPRAARADVRGRYRLVNESGVAIDQVHIRLANRSLRIVGIDVPAARLVHDDAESGYRIYRLDVPMRPGEARDIAFRTVREQIGFRASDPETAIAPNGAELDAFDLTPRVGMHDSGLIEDPATRRAYGLPPARPTPRLDDRRARMTKLSDNAWITADITVSTDADQTPIAPGRQVSSRAQDGRRIARFVSDAPIQNNFSIQSGRYAVRHDRRGGVDYAIYYHPAHRWNVDRMMRAMQASIAYFSDAFGPYQFDQARIVETAYRQGGHAYPNTIAIGETGSFAMDLRDPATMDMVSMFAAHELSHQWWGHQVRGTRMEGTAMLVETLAQYSALMMMRRLEGDHKVRRFLQFQRDRYLSGRRTHVGGEVPLVRVGNGDEHIAYGKGAIAMYLLQHRIGEAAMNRALRRFVDRYRFSTPPYPRSVDLIALLREAATSPGERALVTDLFERVTLYDLAIDDARATRRADGRWDVSVRVRAAKAYADPNGHERPAPLSEPIDIALFASHPDDAGFDRRGVVMRQSRVIRSGEQRLHFVADRRPAHAGIDPDGLYIDRNAEDNVATVGG